MSVKRNPVTAAYTALLSEPEVRMFNALESAWRVLLAAADGLREDRAPVQAEVLEEFAESLQGAAEQMAEEVLGEGGEDLLEGSWFEQTGQEIEQVSLEDDLAAIYADWLRHLEGAPTYRVFETHDEAELAEFLRKVLHFHPALGQSLRPEVTDRQLVAAAQDAYLSQAR